MKEHKILIVDDDPILRDSFGAQLNELNCGLFFAANGQEALLSAQEIQPDLILLDIMLQGMNGFEVCQQLRANPIVAEVPILLITALDDRQSRLRGLESGADDFLVKPVDGLELRTRVQTILRLNRYRKILDERTRFTQILEAKNQQLREISNHLVESQEAERRFIAAELHDDLGQMLTGLKLMIEMAATQKDNEQQKTLERAKGIVSNLSSQVRDLSLDLRPAMLDDYGLFAALEWLFERFTAQMRIKIVHKLEFFDERRFPKPIESAAFRIIQEALTNTVRYAQVTTAQVSLQADEQELAIEISDNGKGFDPAQLDQKGYQSGGLSGMRERTAWLGGTFAIQSKPGAGTTIRATFPLGPQDVKA